MRIREPELYLVACPVCHCLGPRRCCNMYACMYASAICIITMHLFASTSLALHVCAAVKSWMRRSSSRECFACTTDLGSVHGGSIVCAISRLGMDMWVIQLACLHHWSTVVCCYSTPLPAEPSPHTRRRSQCGQPLVSSRISSPSVYAQ